METKVPKYNDWEEDLNDDYEWTKPNRSKKKVTQKKWSSKELYEEDYLKNRKKRSKKR